MPRLRIFTMSTHIITGSCFYAGVLIRVAGNTDDFSPIFQIMFTLSQMVGPSIYVIYTVTQSAYISTWISKHMQTLTDRADKRGQNFQSGDWMPRLRGLYRAQVLLFSADLIAVTALILATILSLDVLVEVSGSVIFVQCLAIGYIFIELRGICLTLNVNNEIEVQKNVRMKPLGRGVKVAEVSTVKIMRSDGTPGTPIVGNSTSLTVANSPLGSGGSSANPAENANPINSKSTGAGSDTTTQLIQSRQGRF